MRRVVALALMFSLAIVAKSQQDSKLIKRESGPPILRTETRLIVEDVTVTDRTGKPVESLPQSAFHIVDETHPQAILSFNESKDSKPPLRSTARPGVLSNASMVDGTANLNVLLLDPIGVELGDQMFLRPQARKFLQSMPEATSVVIFRTSRDGRPLLVQSATDDRTLLLKAVDSCIPTLAVSVPPNETLFNAIGELSNIAEYLGQMRGHKSLIWIAGQFPLAQVLGGNGAQQSSGFSETQEAIKSVYRKLAVARVSVSPIDVRGVVNASINLNLPPGTKADQASTPTVFAGQAAEQQGSWSAMDAIAAATGGIAHYSNNNLTGQIASAVETGRHFYTLAYNPTSYSEDGTWHNVKVTVDGPYSISYRTGYFAQPSAETKRIEASRAKDKGIFTADAPPNMPIVFEPQVQPAKAGCGSLVIQYAIAAGDLSFSLIDNQEHQAQLKIAALSYDASGQVKNHIVDDVTTHYTDQQMMTAQRIGVPVLQNFPTKHGAKFLLLSIVDLETGRTGTVQLPLPSAQ